MSEPLSRSPTSDDSSQAWEWFGTPGHLIVAPSCCFHLHTRIGKYRISTVGCYHPAPDYQRLKPPEEIGCGRLYETMVFELGDDGEPINWSEIDSDGYNEESESQRGHMAVCLRYAEAEPRA